MYQYQEKKILIVDDQRAFQVMLKMMLGNLGAGTLYFADTAEEAVKLCRKIEFDLLLLDYNLGAGRNGRQVLEYLRHNQLVPVHGVCIIVTGDNSRSMVLTALEMEPDDYLMKPFSQNQLHTRIVRTHLKKEELKNIYQALRNKDYEATADACRAQLKGETRYKNYCRKMLAEMLLQTKHYSDAEKLLESLVAKRNLSWANITLGKAYYHLGKYDTAIETLTLTLKHNPLLIDAYEWLGHAYKAKGNMEKALSTISRATELASQSVEKHKLLATLALEMGEHKVAMDSFNAILQLSRNSFYPSPCNLTNYIRSVLLAAKHAEDPQKRNRILQDVNTALFRGRQEEGRDDKFDFATFDAICRARMHEVKGEMLKAKRSLFEAISPVLRDNNDIAIPILSESIIALVNLGEFDYAEDLKAMLDEKDILDSFTKIAISEATGEQLQKRLAVFKELNQMGKKAYTEKDFEASLGYFSRALDKEPMNTGAQINKLQAAIALLSSKRAFSAVLTGDCQHCISLLDGVDLNELHKKRYTQLKEEYLQIITKFKKG